MIERRLFFKDDDGKLMVSEHHPLYGYIEGRPARLTERIRNGLTDLSGQLLAAVGAQPEEVAAVPKEVREAPESTRSGRAERFLAMIDTEFYWGPRRRADDVSPVQANDEEPEEGGRSVRFESYPDGTYDVVFVDPALPDQQ